MSWHIDVSGTNRCLQDLGGLSKKLDVPQAGAMFTNMPAIAPALVMGTILPVVHQAGGGGTELVLSHLKREQETFTEPQALSN